MLEKDKSSCQTALCKISTVRQAVYTGDTQIYFHYCDVKKRRKPLSGLFGYKGEKRMSLLLGVENHDAVPVVDIVRLDIAAFGLN